LPFGAFICERRKGLDLDGFAASKRDTNQAKPGVISEEL